MGTVIYRLFFDPLSKFPGPKLAALSRYYEAYYDVVQNGQYTYVIDQLHREYGEQNSRMSSSEHKLLIPSAKDQSFALVHMSYTSKIQHSLGSCIVKMATGRSTNGCNAPLPLVPSPHSTPSPTTSIGRVELLWTCSSQSRMLPNDRKSSRLM